MKIHVRPLLLIIAATCIALVSCEDVINPTLQSATPVLVVDAWLTNKPGAQRITLTMSQPYFENIIPPAVPGATVLVSDDQGNTFPFAESVTSPGTYEWVPPVGQVFGTVGNTYTLSVQVNGESFQSIAKMGRVPVIDSITFDTEKRTSSTDSLTRAEFWSTDPSGIGDAYWIRSYKNGILLNKPSEINIAFDAGFSAGGATDGVVFITPIRRGVNSRDEDSAGLLISPIENGDSLNVQIHSITKQAFEHLNQVAIQTDRPGGFQELFSTPLANVSTNISNTNANGNRVVGFFNVSAVSIKGKRYKK